MLERSVSSIAASLLTSCIVVAASITHTVGVVAAETDAAENVDALYNLVDVALTASAYLGPFFVILGGIMWGFVQFSTRRDAQKALKFFVAGVLITGLAFGIEILIGLIQFVAEGVA